MTGVGIDASSGVGLVHAFHDDAAVGDQGGDRTDRDKPRCEQSADDPDGQGKLHDRVLALLDGDPPDVALRDQALHFREQSISVDLDLLVLRRGTAGPLP